MDYSAITPKSPRAQVRTYQSFLQRGGFYFGHIDGLWGPVTQRAVEAYTSSLTAGRTVGKVGSEKGVQQIQNRILEQACKFLNLTEISPNNRWDDLAQPGQQKEGLELREELLKVAWQPGWPYCASFTEVCWRYGYQGRPELALISQAITPSVMGTYSNFNELHRITQDPVPGALMLMQSGSSWQGHAGIVAEVRKDTLVTIEGNTSSNRENREGDGVYQKTRPFDMSKRSRGLWIKGFVNPFLV